MFATLLVCLSCSRGTTSARPPMTATTGPDPATLARAFRIAATDHTPSARPTAAPDGRWSDLDRAVDTGCAPFEIAVVRRENRPDGAAVFHVRTLDGRPGRLTLRPTGDAQIFDGVAAIGLVDRDPALEVAIIESVRDALREWGAKRRLTE
ncbi:MAG: hypothetical protein KDA25_04295 [Phycisphaerales bacterium]|nr:hypothetical protein [Phycisphaerales bacterium]